VTQRILAVDDEVHMLRLLERIISEKTPYSIVTTNSSLEVPKLLEEGAFDLVLTDLKMPGIDGLDILRRVKEQGRGEEIVIITAFGSLETAIEALSNDVFDYITKPFKKEQILFTVNKAMRWQRLKREAAAMAALFEPEPYAEAERAFRSEYLRRLGERCAGDRAMMARRSGLPDEDVARCRRDAEAGRG
jgi:DNA-binding NtrC family response regulator